MATITATKEKDMHTVTLTSDEIGLLERSVRNAKADASLALDMPARKALDLLNDAHGALVSTRSIDGTTVELTTEQALTIQRATTYIMTTSRGSKTHGKAAFAMLAQTHGVA